MLVHMHRAHAPGVGVAASRIVPYRSCPGCKPDVKSIKEHAFRVIWIYSDPLIVPVLWIIAGEILAILQGTALRPFHVRPARATICAGPRTKLTAVGTAAAGVAVPDD